MSQSIYQTRMNERVKMNAEGKWRTITEQTDQIESNKRTQIFFDQI